MMHEFDEQAIQELDAAKPKAVRPKAKPRAKTADAKRENVADATTLLAAKPFVPT